MLDFLKTVKAVFVKNVPDTSDSKSVDKTDLAKVVRTGLLVGVASVISYVLSNVAPDTLGHYQPLVVLGLTAVLELINKYIKKN